MMMSLKKNRPRTYVTINKKLNMHCTTVARLFSRQSELTGKFNYNAFLPRKGQVLYHLPAPLRYRLR